MLDLKLKYIIYHFYYCIGSRLLYIPMTVRLVNIILITSVPMYYINPTIATNLWVFNLAIINKLYKIALDNHHETLKWKKH